MKKLSLGGAALAVVMAAPAMAADLPVEAPAYVERPPAIGLWNWTGFYIGADVGYAWGKDHTTEYVTATQAFTGFQWNYKANSFLGGVFAGGNYQIGSFVLGAEGDIEALRVKGGFFDPPGAGDTRMDWQGSFRGRAGFAVLQRMADTDRKLPWFRRRLRPSSKASSA